MMRRLSKQQERKRVRERAQEFIRAAKDRPCADCGIQYHYSVMQFDHIKGTKKMDISKMVRDRYSLPSIRKELSKCEVVCANCHAYRTWERKEGLRTLLDID